jgi:hypothetical protein
MQKNSTTTPQVNKVRIVFTKRKMTAYGGFALIAAFFERIGFAQMIEKAVPITESSPHSMGIYGKVAAYVAMVFAGADRFSHLVYLGNKEVLAKMFGVKRLPDAATTLTRMFNKLKNIKATDVLSHKVWAYLSKLIPGDRIQEDWLTFDSSVLPRYGEQEGVKGVIIPPNMAGRAIASYERIRTRIRILGVIADSGFYLKQFIETLEEEHLAYIIAVRLIRPLQRQIYSLTDWKEVTKGLAVAEFSFMHPLWGREGRSIAVRQDITRRTKAMGKTLPLFANEVVIRDYRYSAWITNSKEPPYEIWTLCKPRANDENTIKELK